MTQYRKFKRTQYYCKDGNVAFVKDTVQRDALRKLGWVRCGKADALRLSKEK